MPTAGHSTIFSVGDLVLVPFPFVEAPRVRYRPALIVSRAWPANGFRLYWAMMVTSSENAGWPDDIEFGPAFADAGLTVPCVIRPAKIASISEDTAKPLGRAPKAILAQVMGVVCTVRT